jgi:type II secretory ATPase GspE/PulE/Tfp pilus assembly ATPase PilB-like protein
VAEPIGLTFATALRSFLRHNPNIMTIGEIRDPETAQIAIRAIWWWPTDVTRSIVSVAD